MPELPEVETVRRGLEPWLAGHVIGDVRVFDDRLVMPLDPRWVEDALRGRTVESVRRRGKYLLVDLSDGLCAEWHLRMTGSFSARPREGEVEVTRSTRHERARLEVGAGIVTFHDPRRFGTLLVGEREIVEARLESKLGPEPLGNGFVTGYLHAALRRRRAPVKAVLLDQRVVAGLGNIYVDEVLHLAGVHPSTPADRIGRVAAERLVSAIQSRLVEAIEAGGSTLRDYRGVEGADGTMQERFVAYGRAGLSCLACGTTMQRGVVGGRGTSWCPRCQRRR